MAVLKGSAGGKEPRSAGVVAVGVDGRRVLVRVVLVHELIIPLLERENTVRKLGGGDGSYIRLATNFRKKTSKSISEGYAQFCKALSNGMFIS